MGPSIFDRKVSGCGMMAVTILPCVLVSDADGQMLCRRIRRFAHRPSESSLLDPVVGVSSSGRITISTCSILIRRHSREVIRVGRPASNRTAPGPQAGFDSG